MRDCRRRPAEIDESSVAPTVVLSLWLWQSELSRGPMKGVEHAVAACRQRRTRQQTGPRGHERMNDYIHFHTRVRIRDGELDPFLEAAAKFVEATKSEAGAHSCACYVDRDTRTVSWFEIFYDLDAFLAHFEHPPVVALQPDMIPRVEEFERLELFGSVPAEVLAGLAEQGFEATCVPEHAGFVGKDQ